MMGLRIIKPMTVHDTFAHPSAFGLSKALGTSEADHQKIASIGC